MKTSINDHPNLSGITASPLLNENQQGLENILYETFIIPF